MEEYNVLVLMSTYNGEKYIREQVESILSQTKVNVSILVRDDGSSDDTVGLLKSLSNEKINIIQGLNVGATKSFFELVKIAREYDFYAFSDQDDVWDKDKLFSAIELLKSSNKPAIYSCATRIVDENLKEIGISKNNPCFSLGSIIAKNFSAGCTQVFNKMLMMELKQSVEIKAPYHDWWINLVCSSIGGDFYYDPTPHLSYRQHGNNVVGSNSGFFSRPKKRLKKFIYQPYHREVLAMELLKYYGQLISNEDALFLKEIADYKKNKRRLLKDKRFVFENKFDHFLFNCCLRFNKL